jgi:uncharacterized protein
MAEDMTDTEIRSLLEHAETIAVVGASSDPDKPAHRIPAELIDRGFDVIPVRPGGGELLGRTAYESLADIPRRIDVVDVFRPADEAPDIARAAVAAGAGALWLQLDLSSDEAREIATGAGLTYVEDRCLGATAREMGIRRRQRT